MSVYETIQHRRSIGKMTEQVPLRAQIERMIEAGMHAPNHHNVVPWKFFVLAGEARNALGEVLERSLAERLVEKTSEKAQAQLAKEHNKPLRAPVLIIVTADAPHQERVLEIENVEATAAAVENMLLVAEELGLATMWRSGDAAYDPNVKAWLGIAQDDHIVAMLYVGYPAIERTERKVVSLAEKTSWLGWKE